VTQLLRPLMLSSPFFFTDTAPTEIYTLSLHDALPISESGDGEHAPRRLGAVERRPRGVEAGAVELGGGRSGMRDRAERASAAGRSEEHTSELQSLAYLVCRLLLEKKKKKKKKTQICL